MNFFADESLGAIPREVFRVSEINFHAGSMGSSVESSSILLIASSHWNIPGTLLRKVPRNPAGKFSRELLHPLLCQLHHELPRDVGRGAPRKLAQKKRSVGYVDAVSHATFHALFYATIGLAFHATCFTMFHATFHGTSGAPPHSPIHANYHGRAPHHASMQTFTQTFTHTPVDEVTTTTAIWKSFAQTSKNKTIFTRSSAESFAQTPAQQ